MSPQPHVVGNTPLAHRVRALLEDSPLGGRPLVVCEWSSLEELRQLDRGSTPWVLVEQGEGGAVCVGPLFGPGAPACFSCYLGRRASNGATECRPCAGEGPAARVASTLRALCQEGLGEGQFQYEVDAEGMSRRHLLLPLPRCATCERRHLPRVRWRELVSARLGLVHKVVVQPSPVAGICVAVAQGCRTSDFHSVRACNDGVAADVDPERAILRATMEALERYCAAFPPPATAPTPASALEGPWMDPMRWLDEPPGDAPARWTRAERLEDGAPTWVPSGLCALPYREPGDAVVPSRQNSTGLALGLEGSMVAEHGLAELLERAAFLRAWRGEHRLSSLPAPLELPGLHLTRIHLENEPRAVVAAFLEKPEPPYTALGLSARASLEEACLVASLEAVQVHWWLKRWVDLRPAPPVGTPRTMLELARVHALRPELKASREPWLSRPGGATGERRGPPSREPLPGPAFHVDLTTRDVAAAGLRAGRVLAPALAWVETRLADEYASPEGAPPPLS